MPNRLVQPDILDIENIHFVEPEKHVISDQVNLFHMRNVPNETARFDLYFDAGKCRGEHGVPAFVNGLLLSGTHNKTSVQISNEINELGGFLETGISAENAVLSIYCLREHLIPIFRTMIDAISNVAFIEKEVEELLADRKQKHLISSEKVGYLAQRAFQERLFASNPLYSTVLKPEDFDSVSIDQLRDFHYKHYLNGLQKVVVVGDLSDAEINTIIEDCEPFVLKETIPLDAELTNNAGKTEVKKDDALQTAIRAGRIMFNKQHPDYTDFLVLNTILGDYFGSRLMSNIREDKGYTYGIGSMLAELNGTGYFLMATEVGKDVKDETLKEMKFEVERLQTELVSEQELQLVRNYMLGQLLKSADGPYAMTDLFLSAEMHGKNLEFYNQALHSINSITPERIRSLAQKYLDWDSFSIVTAG